MPEIVRSENILYRQAESQLRRELHAQLESRKPMLFDNYVLPYLHPFFRSEACEKNKAMLDFRQVVIDFSVDQGLTEERYFNEETAPAVCLQNRSAFVSHILREFKRSGRNDAGPQLMFAQIIDIAKFRRADQARDNSNRGNRGADFNINLIAAKMNERVNAINEIIKGNGLTGYIMPCRYGGDELGIAFVDIPDEAFRRTAYQAIVGENGFRDGITYIEGYIQISNQNVKRRIKLKPEVRLKKIEIPTDTLRQEIFWDQLNKGLLLNSEEIEAILLENEPIEEKPPINSNYPHTVEEFDAYLDQTIRKHPELRDRLEIVRNAGHDEDAAAASFVRSEFPRIVRDIVYDRLLGERVTSFGDLAGHIDEFSDLFVFDMKGIKEFNDYQSIATGDRAVMALWRAIQSQIGYNIEKVMCFRRGSTFIVGVRGTDSTEIKQRLASISFATFQGYEHQLGLYHSVVNEEFPVAKRIKKQCKEYLDHIIGGADTDWNRQLIINHLREHPELLEERQIRKGAKYSYEEEIGIYFNGPRSLERLRKLIETMLEMQGNISDESLVKLRLAISKQLVITAQKEIRTKIYDSDKEELIDLIYTLGLIADLSHMLDIHPGNHEVDRMISCMFELYGLDGNMGNF